MSFAAIFCTPNSCHLVADSLLTSLGPDIGPMLPSDQTLSTGLIIDSAKFKTAQFAEHALKIINFGGMAIAFVGHWGLANRAMQLLKAKFFRRAGVHPNQFFEYLATLFPIEVDLKYDMRLEALGLLCASGCLVTKFYVNLRTGEFGVWQHDEFFAIGSGRDSAATVYDLSKQFIETTERPVEQHTIFCNTFIATQTSQERHLNLDQLIGGAPYGVFSYDEKIWWAPARTILTYYGTATEPISVDLIGAYRIEQQKQCVFSFSADMENLSSRLVLRTNSISEKFTIEDLRNQMTLNSDYLSLSSFFGSLSAQNIAGIMLTKDSRAPAFFTEELDVSLSMSADYKVTSDKMIYTFSLSAYARKEIEKAFLETYGRGVIWPDS
jgi:hypothetical protein